MHDPHQALNAQAAAALAADAWQLVREGWNDEKRHQKFVALCDELDLLDWAVKRYAETRPQRPGDSHVQRMSAQILLLAQMRLDRSRTKRVRSPTGSKIRLALILLVLLLVPLLLMWTLASQRNLQQRLAGESKQVARPDAGPLAGSNRPASQGTSSAEHR
jgi:hypothetical protein